MLKSRAWSLLLLLMCAAAGCSKPADPVATPAPPRNLLLITIDTLRADRIGAYGYARARTPVIDALAARGARFQHAFSAAPITLPSHASLMTGRYPPGHNGRDNGMRIDTDAPLLAESLSMSGFVTGAFVAAFPLDRRFGLEKGFQTYGDRMPRGPQGRPQNERPGRLVADDAIGWLTGHRQQRFFLWVHLFEPHAPYAAPGDGRPAQDRYDDEIAEADRQIGRVIEALGDARDSTLIVLTSDHGEAFGEHGEIGHSIFVYDTTLRVPLIAAGPSIQPRVVDAPVSLVDVAPTVMRLLGTGAFDADGIDLSPAISGGDVPARELYAESFAPMLQFGWSPLRAIRSDGYKYIDAPRPELFAIERDPDENANIAAKEIGRTKTMRERIARIWPASVSTNASVDRDAAARLQALGYASGSHTTSRGSKKRPDPKDRRELAARIARVTSGELSGAALEQALRLILKEDPDNSQAHLRLGYVLEGSDRCAEAELHFRAAIAARLPSADAHLGLAGCFVRANRPDEALAVLRDAESAEPGNPVVLANSGLILSDTGHVKQAVRPLQQALVLDPDLNQARFALAIALAEDGRRAEAANEARELLRRLAPDAPQRAEVERLLRALQ